MVAKLFIGTWLRSSPDEGLVKKRSMKPMAVFLVDSGEYHFASQSVGSDFLASSRKNLGHRMWSIEENFTA
jgi:hypothetical protein